MNSNHKPEKVIRHSALLNLKIFSSRHVAFLIFGFCRKDPACLRDTPGPGNYS